MKEYTSGKLCKPFKAIPLIEQWDKVAKKKNYSFFF